MPLQPAYAHLTAPQGQNTAMNGGTGGFAGSAPSAQHPTAGSYGRYGAMGGPSQSAPGGAGPMSGPAGQIGSGPQAAVSPQNQFSPTAAPQHTSVQASGQTNAAASPPVVVAEHIAPPNPSSGRTPLGLEGYCPVTLRREQRWAPGDKRFGIIHRGCLYLFAGPQQQQQFWENPDSFSPVLSGSDPVLALDNGATVAGQREYGVEYNGQVYLFSSESTLQHFSRNPERYAGGVRQAMQVSTGTTLR